jgi:hypothetical protein
MRSFKPITMIMVATLVALLYVHQQVELVKLSYAIGCREKKLKDILDRHEGLGYNIGNLEAPCRLEEALLAQRIEVAFPKQANVVRMASLRPAGRVRQLHAMATKTSGAFGIFDFLSPRAEAQTHEK